ncbi:hypothetical protein M5D96_006178 [Drosophila gunungcola]|uniref:Uncharacterized protein n=1 Tax=Drosophila gunungcola TaxID=103775 RepID=A0A9P9YP66_9MUSC|nr:hypothetical protein M5D96_006178 [Drosophila gunungcola]
MVSRGDPAAWTSMPLLVLKAYLNTPSSSDGETRKSVIWASRSSPPTNLRIRRTRTSPPSTSTQTRARNTRPMS